eukprot:2048252-Alexandrium_andersonii.AAC.1
MWSRVARTPDTFFRTVTLPSTCAASNTKSVSKSGFPTRPQAFRRSSSRSSIGKNGLIWSSTASE